MIFLMTNFNVFFNFLDFNVPFQVTIGGVRLVWEDIKTWLGGFDEWRFGIFFECWGEYHPIPPIMGNPAAPNFSRL